MPDFQIRPAARIEIGEIADHLAQFRVEETFARLAVRPGLGEAVETTVPALAGLRCTPIDRLKAYTVFYLTRDDGIEVVHVRHGARDTPWLFDSSDEGRDVL